MLKQSFTVVPQGIIQSGVVDYQIDEATGKGLGSYDIIAGFLFITKEVKGSGAFKADPKQFLSSNVKKGQVIRAGDVVLTVLDVSNGEASVGIALQNDSDSVSGVAKLDVSKEYLSIKSATVSGNVLGYNITLEVQPV